jgi:hypothetical protein
LHSGEECRDAEYHARKMSSREEGMDVSNR